jgi:predicted nucleic acid-binding protein
MAVPLYRIFFDTSAYIAALNSPKGAAEEFINLAEAGALRIVVSQKVIIEADRVLAIKFPELIQENLRFWKNLTPEIAPTPTINQAKPFLQMLPEADGFILCAAHLARVSMFVTWNTRDFMARDVASLVDFPIVIPADGLKLFREWIKLYLE